MMLCINCINLLFVPLMRSEVRLSKRTASLNWKHFSVLLKSTSDEWMNGGLETNHEHLKSRQHVCSTLAYFTYYNSC